MAFPPHQKLLSAFMDPAQSSRTWSSRVLHWNFQETFLNNNRPYSLRLPSLQALKDWWDKSDVTWFLRGKQVINFSNTTNCSRVCLLLTSENKKVFTLKNSHEKKFSYIVEPLFRGHPRDQKKYPLDRGVSLNGGWTGGLLKNNLQMKYFSFIRLQSLLQPIFKVAR